MWGFGVLTRNSKKKGTVQMEKSKMINQEDTITGFLPSHTAQGPSMHAKFQLQINAGFPPPVACSLHLAPSA